MGMGIGRQDNRILLASSALFVVGLFVGFGAAALLPSKPASATERGERAIGVLSPPGAAARSDALARALTELGVTLNELRAVLERSSSEPQPAPTLAPGRAPAVAAKPTPVTSDLAASMDALAAALRTLSQDGAGRGRTSRTLEAPAWVDRRVAFDTGTLRELCRTDEDGERTELAVQAWRKKHLFWTMQEILDHYGKPDEVSPDNGFVDWFYFVRRGDVQENIWFAFDEGVVVGGDYNYDWEE